MKKFIYSGGRVKKRFRASYIFMHMMPALKSISAIMLCILAFDVSAEEPISSPSTEASANAEDLNNNDSKEIKDPRYGIGSGFITDGLDSGFSSQDGAIRQTDFSKETGFSRETRSVNSSGFSNRIFINSAISRDSNPSLVSTNKTPVWIYSLIPEVLLNYNTELNRVFFNAALNVQRHSNERVLIDREDPRFSLGWERKYVAGTFGLNASFSQTSSRGEELRATGIFSNVNFVKTKAKNKSLVGTWEHELAERWTVLTQGAYEENTFSNVQGLNDTTLINLRSKLTYANSDRLNTYVQVGYTELRPAAVIEDSEIVRLASGADYQLTEAFSLSARANVYKLSGVQSDEGWEAGIKLLYDIERMSFNAELSRGLPDTAAGNFQKTDTLGLGWAFDVSSNDTLGANYAFSKVNGNNKNEAREIRVFYGRVLSSGWSAQASASFREQDTQTLYSNGNLIGISLTYGGLSF